MIRHMRHGSPPRLMALQLILSPNRRESLPTGSAGVRIRRVREGRCRSGNGFVPWILDLLQRKPPKLVAVALANKLARIAWKLMVTGEAYAATRSPVTAAGA